MRALPIRRSVSGWAAAIATAASAIVSMFAFVVGPAYAHGGSHEFMPPPPESQTAHQEASEAPYEQNAESGGGRDQARSAYIGAVALGALGSGIISSAALKRHRRLKEEREA